MKISAKVSQRLVWFDVGPEKGIALTLKTSSPYYNEDHHTPTGMVTAYFRVDYDAFLKDAIEFTGLDIVEFDTHYTLQFLVDMGDGKLTEKTAGENLASFVRLHFKDYDSEADDKA